MNNTTTARAVGFLALLIAGLALAHVVGFDSNYIFYPLVVVLVAEVSDPILRVGSWLIKVKDIVLAWAEKHWRLLRALSLFAACFGVGVLFIWLLAPSAKMWAAAVQSNHLPSFDDLWEFMKGVGFALLVLLVIALLLLLISMSMKRLYAIAPTIEPTPANSKVNDDDDRSVWAVMFAVLALLAVLLLLGHCASKWGGEPAPAAPAVVAAPAPAPTPTPAPASPPVKAEPWVYTWADIRPGDGAIKLSKRLGMPMTLKDAIKAADGRGCPVVWSSEGVIMAPVVHPGDWWIAVHKPELGTTELHFSCRK